MRREQTAGPPAGARRGGRRPRALVRGARDERPPLPALLRRPGFLPRAPAARLAPRAATAAAEAPLSPAPGGESTSTGAYAASGRRRLSAPGAPPLCRRLTRLRAPSALPAPTARRLPSAPPPPPPPPPGAHPRPRLPGAERLLSARPPPRHTHTFSSFSELEHRSGREAAAAAAGGRGGGGGGGSGRRRRERGGGAARPLLEGSPGLAAAARAAQCGSRLARAPPGLGRPWELCGRLPLPRPLRGPRAPRSRPPPAEGGVGSPQLSQGGRQPAAARRLPGRGEAGIWRPLPPFQPTGPGARPRPSGNPQDSAPRAPCTGCHRGHPAQLPAGGRGARAPRSWTAQICWRDPLQPLLYSFPFLFL